MKKLNTCHGRHGMTYPIEDGLFHSMDPIQLSWESLYDTSLESAYLVDCRFWSEASESTPFKSYNTLKFNPAILYSIDMDLS